MKIGKHHGILQSSAFFREAVFQQNGGTKVGVSAPLDLGGHISVATGEFLDIAAIFQKFSTREIFCQRMKMCQFFGGENWAGIKKLCLVIHSSELSFGVHVCQMPQKSFAVRFVDRTLSVFFPVVSHRGSESIVEFRLAEPIDAFF